MPAALHNMAPAKPARRLWLRALTGLMLGSACRVAAAADDVIVIVHKDNSNTVDLNLIQRIYSGAVRGWPDGTGVVAYDQPDDADVRTQFVQHYLGKTMATHRALWSQNIFTGKGLPPKVLAGDAEVRRMVAANRQAIGYIRASALDPSVRAVSRDGR